MFYRLDSLLKRKLNVKMITFSLFFISLIKSHIIEITKVLNWQFEIKFLTYFFCKSKFYNFETFHYLQLSWKGLCLRDVYCPKPPTPNKKPILIPDDNTFKTVELSKSESLANEHYLTLNCFLIPQKKLFG